MSRRAPLAAGLAAAVLVALPGPASADGPADAEAQVQDIVAPVEDLIFSEGSLDGALTDTGHREFRLAADVLFAFDKADLTPRARALLAQVSGTMREQRAAAVTVTGYTDAVGKPAYNLGLSRRRAQAVATALGAGLPGVRITPAGLGEGRPVATNDTPAGRALNRRVEIRITG
jgi:outer membrane protein OmpA-like peptidoglycan-associated protein